MDAANEIRQFRRRQLIARKMRRNNLGGQSQQSWVFSLEAMIYFAL